MENKLDMSTLSKKKHIMRARLDKLGKLHQERLPVIYINGKTVYYKTHCVEDLQSVPLWIVQQDIPVAVVMEQFKAGGTDNLAFYWNPAPQARLDAMEISFASTAMLDAVEKSERDVSNATQWVDYWGDELLRHQARLEADKENLNRSIKVWQDRLMRQAGGLNSLIKKSGPIKSVFIHSGEHLGGQSDKLAGFNYKTAQVFNVKPSDGAGFRPYCLICDIRFEDWDRQTFQVPDYTLMNLYENFE